jgi:hypothetical protein
MPDSIPAMDLLLRLQQFDFINLKSNWQKLTCCKQPSVLTSSLPLKTAWYLYLPGGQHLIHVYVVSSPVVLKNKNAVSTPHYFAFESVRFSGAEIYLYSLVVEMLGYEFIQHGSHHPVIHYFHGNIHNFSTNKFDLGSTWLINRSCLGQRIFS